jgi:hypothetical protein
MGIGILTDENAEQLAHYLLQRQAKERIVSLLQEVKDAKNLKLGDVTVSKSATYEQLVWSLNTALREDWLAPAALVKVLEELEVAGRQHVILFHVKANKLTELAGILAAPTHRRDTVDSLDEFWSVPDQSFARVLRNDAQATMTKIVAARNYHTVETLEQTVDYELFQRLRHRERSAVIVKFTRDKRILQIRIPPREHGAIETARRVLDYAKAVLAGHFDTDNVFACLKEFPLNEALPKIIKNRTDFTLEHDTPEDPNTKTTMSRQRSPNGKAGDLRDCDAWKFDKGYSRKTLRGSWANGAQALYAHINLDMIQVDRNTVQTVARLFIPGQCSDPDVDHVVGRIHDHTE